MDDSPKINSGQQPSTKQRARRPLEPQQYTIAEFCETHALAKSTLYVLIARGTGPRLMKLGKRTYVSAEAARAWRAANEEHTRASGAYESSREEMRIRAKARDAKPNGRAAAAH